MSVPATITELARVLVALADETASADEQPFHEVSGAARAATQLTRTVAELDAAGDASATRSVLDFVEGLVVHAAELVARISANFILGLGKLEEKVPILLDIDRIMTSVELEKLEEQAAASG